MPNVKKKIERIENFTLFFIVFALLFSALTLLQVQQAAPYIIFNICLLLVSRTMLKRDYGTDIFHKPELPEMHPKMQLLLGAVYGTLIFLHIFLLLLHISALFSISLPLFPWLVAETTIKYVVLYIVLNMLMQIAASYAEEAFWRQYFWKVLEDVGLPRIAVLLLITLLFTLVHKPGRSWLSIALIGLVSLELGMLRLKYGEKSFLLTGTVHFVFNLLNVFIA